MNKPNLDAVGSISREEASVIAYLYGCPLEAKPKWISVEEVQRKASSIYEINIVQIHDMKQRGLLYHAPALRAIALTPAGEVMAKEITA